MRGLVGPRDMAKVTCLKLVFMGRLAIEAREPTRPTVRLVILNCLLSRFQVAGVFGGKQSVLVHQGAYLVKSAAEKILASHRHLRALVQNVCRR